MGRVTEYIPTEGDWPALVRLLTDIRRQVDGLISFGHPQDPQNEGGSTLAGSTSTAHPGTLSNMDGSWVELDVTALDTPVACYHNLNIPVSVSGEPNVRWLVWGWVHDGNSADVASAPAALFEEVTNTVAANSIELSFYCAGARVVDGDHPLKVTLWFMPAVRRP